MRGNGDSAERERWARRARSFGTQAAVYAEHRPDYALAAIRWALEPVGAIEAPAVLDLGAGTGKLTDGLLAVGAEAVAVEPDASMRAEFVRRYPAVTILAGTAEEIPLPDDSVDAVVAGQAFHWFEQSRAFPEIARVLRPGGVFAAFWNIEDGAVEWVAGLQRVARSEASTPSPPPDEPLPSHPLFAPFEKAVFAHAQRRTVDSLVETLGTHSHTVVIPADQRAALLGRIRDYLRVRPETAAGEFDYPLHTEVIRAVPR
ncbi:class I SAM-dependent methyltransferase [Nocardia asteroides]|uniref:class I SAM-dependent methyltransferase n=1 Tax=Nocardia asteroides TaxID=1824 RepID=UPI001E406AE0|nr:class I SAM-dependent methyltransferase [Nocardia asteroides]UGT55464.1 class I SAM-dependent methyltransferase [Nocardia asteroides]